MIHLNRKKGSAPLYQQIYQQVKSDILLGYLSPNEKILGTRTLAKMLGVSRNTVDRAYMQLTLEGYIESRQNAGFYVLKLPKAFQSEKTFTEEFSDTKKQATDEHIIYDLTNSSHTSNLFPKKVWKKHYQNAIEQLDEAEKLYTLQPFQGDFRLRKEISRYLERIRGVRCQPSQIIITSGLQQSFPIVTAKVDEKGLNLENIDENARIEMIYTTPSHQFPLGMIMPISRRQELLAFAQEKDSFIIEDDYDSELRYYERPIPALKSIDYLDRVIYLGTFSKILSPSFRMSYIVLPDQFTEAFLEKFQLYNSTVNLLNQIALANILSSGDYDRLVRKMNHVFKKRYEAFKKEFEQFQSPIKLSSNVSGQYFLVTFPDKINQCDLIKQAENEGVRVYDTMQFWQEKAACPQESLFLGFSKIDLENIPDCVSRLRRAWD
ncbi:PLP-dependent aminotransferase family protein [Streptococcus gallolyticus subsp. gallolyticus]|uniref:aminotransferase-like domain-containing protein n=1 Tax=Streptococcus gallolyticus TaxID=315405 RepID=UPI000210B88B|nr:PLP-dependent aminotransferase family protein [Streptococcus gallolyticus]MCY7157829.1 PLP-dependent aminotransferase family protein [Streptococcus gallolyticus subsp. gallolyticus]BAK27740.1 GntR family transcriptional regulator / MocR family aminotransferase [Streptococcus gallolyticus subsp. gallolyticus ATCC 43143]